MSVERLRRIDDVHSRRDCRQRPRKNRRRKYSRIDGNDIQTKRQGESREESQSCFWWGGCRTHGADVVPGRSGGYIVAGSVQGRHLVAGRKGCLLASWRQGQDRRCSCNHLAPCCRCQYAGACNGRCRYGYRHLQGRIKLPQWKGRLLSPRWQGQGHGCGDDSRNSARCTCPLTRTNRHHSCSASGCCSDNKHCSRRRSHQGKH